MKTKQNCKNCHKEFERYTSQMTGKDKYCSRKCVNEAKKYYEYKHGKDHPLWKGGKNKNHDGYISVYIPTHPNARSNGYIFEHRIIMENNLGRYLSKQEVVDHINGIKDDNRLENLRLFEKHGDHIKIEATRGTYKNVLKNRQRNYLGYLL